MSTLVDGSFVPPGAAGILPRTSISTSNRLPSARDIMESDDEMMVDAFDGEEETTNVRVDSPSSAILPAAAASSRRNPIRALPSSASSSAYLAEPYHSYHQVEPLSPEEEDEDSEDDSDSSSSVDISRVVHTVASEDELEAAAVEAGSEEIITDVDDDELTILAVRRALHLPPRPEPNQTIHRRVVHSPVNLADEEDEKSPAKAGNEDEEDPDADVCAVCLSVPTETTTTSACKHAFCFPCIAQWTKIQLAALYQSQEESRWATAVPGFVPAANEKTKKKAPSCPLCKGEYTALHKRLITSTGAPSTSSTAFEVIQCSTILPPPTGFHRPQLTLNTSYAHIDAFRLAFEAGMSFAMRTAPGLRTHLLAELLARHPRMNQLLLSHAPFRDRFREVRAELIEQILTARHAENRRMGLEAQQGRRALAMAVDRGDGLPTQVPMMNSSNAHTQLVNRMSPYGTQSLLSLAFGEVPTQAPNPIITMYRESRYQGGMTHAAGRMRLWRDLRLQYVPPQPDVIWALRQCEVGRGMVPFPPTLNPNSAAANAANVIAGNSAPPAAAASQPFRSSPPRQALTRWLNTELTSILSSRQSQQLVQEANGVSGGDGSGVVSEHFMVTLVLSYLELTLSKLLLEEKELELRRQRPRERRRARKERPAAATPSVNLVSPVEESKELSHGVPAAAASSSSVGQPSIPALANSFVPSYFASGSSLHPVAADARLSLPVSEEGKDGADAIPSQNDDEVVVLRRSRSRPSASPPTDERDVIVLTDEENEATDAAPTGHTSVQQQPQVHSIDSDDDLPMVAQEEQGLMAVASTTESNNRVSNSHLPGGHLHTLFALSAPLSSAVDFLHAKLEEFLRGFTGVFVHRLLLFILSRSYNRAGSGPPPKSSSNTTAAASSSSTAAVVASPGEETMHSLLEDARRKWREERDMEVYGRVNGVASSPLPAPAASAVSIDGPPMIRGSSLSSSHHRPASSRLRVSTPLRSPPRHGSSSEEDDMDVRESTIDTREDHAILSATSASIFARPSARKRSRTGRREVGTNSSTTMPDGNNEQLIEAGIKSAKRPRLLATQNE